METASNFKSGLAVLVGRTNVGKSTLLNALVGTKIAIVTPKPQTTRDTYHGIVHRPEGQIVFVDTPGIFKTQPSKLVQNLHHKVRDAIEGIDVIVHVVDPTRAIGPEDNMVNDLVAHVAQPRILCLNKLDLPDRYYRESWLERAQGVAAAVPAAQESATTAPETGAATTAGRYASVVEVSALKEKNVELLIQAIFRHLPVGRPQYPDGQVTNATNEFWITEVIREKVYLQTSQEVPYTTAVQVERIEDRKDKQGKPLLYIKAAVLTTDERHQRMLIGQGAKKIKEIGSAARHELEIAMNRKVFLDLAVLVDEEWMERLT
jgi:GTPase